MLKASELLKMIEEEIEANGDMDVIVQHGGDGSVQFCDKPQVYPRFDVVSEEDEVERDASEQTSHVLMFRWSF